MPAQHGNGGMSDAPSSNGRRPLRRVGHKGADHIAPGNTFASFAAALAHDVDMIEFDVLPEHPDGSGKLLLAHDWEDAAKRTPHTLEEGLEHFADAAYAGVELLLDLKTVGYEERVVAALRAHGLDGRVLISTTENPSLALLRARHPQLALSWSLPRMHRNPLANPVTALPALAVLTYVRRALPGVAANRIRRGEVDALTVHYRLVTARLADAVHAAGGEIYAWTVDDATRIAELERLGVTGVISNDPRLFDGPR